MNTALFALSRASIFLVTYLVISALYIRVIVQQQYSGEAFSRAFGMGLGWQTILSLFAAFAHGAVALVFSMVSRSPKVFAWWMSAASAVVTLTLDYAGFSNVAVLATDVMFGQSSMWLVVFPPAVSALVATGLSLIVMRMLVSRFDGMSPNRR